MERVIRGEEMQKYSISIHYSEEDSCYVAAVPELFGCMAHGDSYNEAMEEVQVAMKLWLEIAEEHGDVIPKPLTYTS